MQQLLRSLMASRLVFIFELFFGYQLMNFDGARLRRNTASAYRYSSFSAISKFLVTDSPFSYENKKSRLLRDFNRYGVFHRKIIYASYIDSASFRISLSLLFALLTASAALPFTF